MPALLLLMLALRFAVEPTAFYDPPWLILIGNTLFVGIISFTVAGIAWRNFSATGRIEVLLLGCAMLLFGAGGVLAAAVRGLPDGANDNVTIYNIGALAGAVLHFVAALVLLEGGVSKTGARRRKEWLTLGYGGAVLFMALLTAASFTDVIPPFFIQGVGPTPLRQYVLGAANLLFVVTFLLFMASYRRKREPFLYWYAGGLALTAISLTCFFIQTSVGSPVGWTGRLAQYLGGIYFLVSLVATERSARQQGASFDEVLTASLTPAEEKFRAAFANAAIGFAMVTPAGRYLDANPAYCALTGYSLAELQALEFPDLIHPDDRAANMTQIRRMLAGEIPDFTIENRYLRKGGQEIWVRKSVSLARGPQGTPRWIMALIEDVTGRRRAEERIKLLLREVNHRAKNILAVVESVARQTAAVSPEDFLERFSERIRAMATNQDLLVRAGWKGVELADLVRGQLAHFQDLIGARIEPEGPPIVISSSAAQTLGMAIHELATNAAKYGALSVAEGRVAIAWWLERDGASGETFTMSWREEGGPTVAPPSKIGFGSTVIGPLAESSLNAKVDLEFSRAGLCWRLRCSAGEIAEAHRSAHAPNATEILPNSGIVRELSD